MRLLPTACLAVLLATPALAQNGPSFTVANRSGAPIRELFVTSAGNANWGQNRLDGRSGHPTVLASGARFSVPRRPETNCIYDLRAVFADGKAEDRRKVNTCAVEEIAFGAPPVSEAAIGPTGKAPDDPSIRLFNRAARAMIEFHAMPASSGTAGPNRLSGPLSPDTGVAIALPRDGSCIFDLRAVFADGRALEKKRSNLCAVAELPVP